MKNILIAVFAVLVFNAVFVFSGGLELLMQTDSEAKPEVSIGQDIVTVFQFTLEDEVRKKIGAPVDGFEPDMFLEVFSGLVETDFDGVEASIGQYIVVDGKLTYVADDTKLMHSAATSVGRAGMETLLKNLAKRIDIDLTTGGTITDVMNALTREGQV